MRYFVEVAYDGYNYNGYQKQKHDKNTIQEVIENAIAQIFKEQITIYASGRTDKQVHALAQPFHFDSNKIIPLVNLKKALNELLPLDIKVNKVKKVKDDFHARFSKTKKEYEYRIINKKDVDPFKARYNTYIKETINFELLEKASKLFIGTHDFVNFTTNTVEEVENFIKTIYDIKVTKNGKSIKINFIGSGFLRYQIRMMVGAMIVVATNKKDISYIENMLKENSNNRCSYKAAPNGLYLKKVWY